jgi:hypothetical protein
LRLQCIEPAAACQVPRGAYCPRLARGWYKTCRTSRCAAVVPFGGAQTYRYKLPTHYLVWTIALQPGSGDLLAPVFAPGAGYLQPADGRRTLARIHPARANARSVAGAGAPTLLCFVTVLKSMPMTLLWALRIVPISFIRC